MEHIRHLVDIILRKTFGGNRLFEKIGVHHLLLHIGEAAADTRGRISFPADNHHQLAVRGRCQCHQGREIRSRSDLLFGLYTAHQRPVSLILHQIELVQRIRMTRFRCTGPHGRHRPGSERTVLPGITPPCVGRGRKVIPVLFIGKAETQGYLHGLRVGIDRHDIHPLFTSRHAQ